MRKKKKISGKLPRKFRVYAIWFTGASIDCNWVRNEISNRFSSWFSPIEIKLRDFGRDFGICLKQLAEICKLRRAGKASSKVLMERLFMLMFDRIFRLPGSFA